MEPKVPSTWLLHIIIPSFVIALIFIVTMIILKKQLCQKLSSRKGRWVLFTVTMWTGCLQWRALLSPLASRFPVSYQIHSVVMNCFGFVLMIFPPEENGTSLQWAKTLTLNILKGIFCFCGWNRLLYSLSREVPSASWDWCYFGNVGQLCGQHSLVGRCQDPFWQLLQLSALLASFWIWAGLSPPLTPRNLNFLVG